MLAGAHPVVVEQTQAHKPGEKYRGLQRGELGTEASSQVTARFRIGVHLY
jgi:hypothetical protein